MANKKKEAQQPIKEVRPIYIKVYFGECTRKDDKTKRNVRLTGWSYMRVKSQKATDMIVESKESKHRPGRPRVIPVVLYTGVYVDLRTAPLSTFSAFVDSKYCTFTGKETVFYRPITLT